MVLVTDWMEWCPLGCPTVSVVSCSTLRRDQPARRGLGVIDIWSGSQRDGILREEMTVDGVQLKAD